MAFLKERTSLSDKLPRNESSAFSPSEFLMEKVKEKPAGEFWSGESRGKPTGRRTEPILVVEKQKKKAKKTALSKTKEKKAKGIT